MIPSRGRSTGRRIVTMPSQAAAVPTPKRKVYRHLYFQVLCAIAIGVLLGYFYPSLGARLKPLGDMFIQAIKMVIAPIIFCTVVHGIASMEDMKKVGRVGLKALIYFEVLTTLALIVGLIVVNILQPGGTTTVATPLPTRLVSARASDMNRSTPRMSAMLVTATGWQQH